MRVFLRNIQSRLYWAESNGWVPVSWQAFDFTSFPQAARCALSACLAEVEIVVMCDSLQDEVIMPVLPEYCDNDQPGANTA